MAPHPLHHRHRYLATWIQLFFEPPGVSKSFKGFRRLRTKCQSRDILKTAQFLQSSSCVMHQNMWKWCLASWNLLASGHLFACLESLFVWCRHVFEVTQTAPMRSTSPELFVLSDINLERIGHRLSARSRSLVCRYWHWTPDRRLVRGRELLLQSFGLSVFHLKSTQDCKGMQSRCLAQGPLS